MVILQCSAPALTSCPLLCGHFVNTHKSRESSRPPCPGHPAPHCHPFHTCFELSSPTLTRRLPPLLLQSEILKCVFLTDRAL
jgi:hypothetical protein